MQKTTEITVTVPTEHSQELALALAAVAPTTRFPFPGERVLVLGLQAIKRQHRRRTYQRQWHRTKRGKA
jgi:hypothetical protein